MFVFTTNRPDGLWVLFFFFLGLLCEYLFVHTAAFTSSQTEGGKKHTHTAARTDRTAIKATCESPCVRHCEAFTSISHVGFFGDAMRWSRQRYYETSKCFKRLFFKTWGRYGPQIKRTTQYKDFFKLVKLKPSLGSAARKGRPPPPGRRSPRPARPKHYDGN